jgi:DNA-binding transcriptional MocR family regulator
VERKHEIIQSYLIRQIESGSLQAGRKMPSVRELSRLFDCGPNTAVRAYQELERTHLVYSVAKSGYYLVEGPKRAHTVEHTFNFASGSPNPLFLPISEFRHCLQQASILYQEELFHYPEPLGMLSLRQELQKHLRNHQVFADTSQICIITGAQQAFSIVTRMPFPNGRSRILVEQPTYMGMLETAQLHGCPLSGIARGEQGIDFDELETHFRSGEFKCFYTVPRFLNPLGASYTREQRKRIAALAKKYDVYIIEDDYLVDLETDTKADPVYSFDDSSHTLYIKSYSKITMPGLRIGAAVLPPQLVPLFAAYKQASDLSTPALSQAALEIYLKSGLFDRHTAQLRKHYLDKMTLLKQMCALYIGPYASFTLPKAGIFVSVTLPAPLKASRLIERLGQQSVTASNLDRHYLPENRHDDMIRLCVNSLEITQIEQGIRLIGREIAYMGGMSAQWNANNG